MAVKVIGMGEEVDMAVVMGERDQECRSRPVLTELLGMSSGVTTPRPTHGTRHHTRSRTTRRGSIL